MISMVSDPLSHFLGVAVVSVISCLVLWLAMRRTVISVRRWAMASFAGHAMLAILIWYQFTGLVASDGRAYDGQAQLLAGAWHGGGSVSLYAGKEGFSMVLASIYWAVGHVPVAGLILNALAMGLLVVVVSNTTRTVGGDHAARVAAMMATLFPGLVYWGAQLLREPFVWLLLGLVAESTLMFLKQGASVRRGLRLIVCCLLLFPMRGPVAAVVVVSTGLVLVLGLYWRPRQALRTTLVIGSAIALSAMFLAGYRGFSAVQEQATAERIAISRNAVAVDSTTGLGTVVEPTTSGLTSQLPTTIPIVLFGPFPWNLPAAGLAVGFDTLAWWLLLILGWAGFARLRRRDRIAAWTPILPIISILFVLAYTLGNVGLMIRLRAMVVIYLLPLAAVGVSRLSVWRRRAKTPNEMAPVLRREASVGATRA